VIELLVQLAPQVTRLHRQAIAQVEHEPKHQHRDGERPTGNVADAGERRVMGGGTTA
jgi:hypothetical protein